MTSDLKLWEEGLNRTLTTLAAEGERNRNSLNSYSRVVDACLGTLTKDIEELKGRVQNLEEQPRIVTAGSQDDDRVSPAPPAPLVERICLIFHKQQSPARPGDCEMAKEALLVAAEELLGPVTDGEVESVTAARLVNAVNETRLARAKEAARG